MQKVYRAQVLYGDSVREEILLARSRDEAMVKLTEMEMKPIEVKHDANATFAMMTTSELDGRELAQFYFTLGRRVASGMNVVVAVREAANFTRNAAVAIVLSTLASAVERGADLDTGMREAGLDKRDWSIVRALREAGQLEEALTGLGRDYQRRSMLRRRLRGLVIEPIGFFAVIYVLMYLGIVFLAPRIRMFFKRLSMAKMPALAKHVYGFTATFNAHLVLSTAIYLGIGIGLVFFVRSRYARKLLDMVSVFKDVADRADHAGLWSIFAMLYASGMRRDDAAKMVAATAVREENREAFIDLANRVEAGQPVADAIGDAGFPNWVSSAVANALVSGGADDVVSALNMFTDNLATDVEMLTERLAAFVRATTTVFMGLSVLMLAFITVLPMIQGALSAA